MPPCSFDDELNELNELNTSKELNDTMRPPPPSPEDIDDDDRLVVGWNPQFLVLVPRPGGGSLMFWIPWRLSDELISSISNGDISEDTIAEWVGQGCLVREFGLVPIGDCVNFIQVPIKTC